ncbi:hypothetical protein FC52_GL000946 [Lactobacillus pasteurii DSM 23907 = CRBIP 24.76]|uniref:Uncharacterized protein n=1 Tax=Lactobacillus pasteurii DSM 23907 = CRBIP 24.76 TaxID=1423790 RepID=I7KKX0_9LACO|nr:hypothetical protein [Lactobacillus pasteurii]KRK08210.1 hypothetical protein FC52_GL000946 [Lactobacillus pasteurii DSM 23907 = CRBIP 24.76]TDG77329.1 hypothetical protein C5L33_000772 [Lactobacillus pasteurii]CCI84874.1 Protein of unknown function [Lactobacillus pasteurii DSM 23907 = CRBIP 24.76]
MEKDDFSKDMLWTKTVGSHSKVDPILWILIAFAACLIIGSKYIPTINKGN